MRKKNLLLMIIILIIGCTLRCWNIRQSFWWDEIWSTLPYAQGPGLWQLFSSLGYYFNNHIFYSLLCRISMRLLGADELGARIPALLMGLLGIWVLFQFSKKFIGAGPGLIASFLLAISAFHIDHSTEARGYAGLALFSLLSTYYFLQALRTNRKKDWGFHIVWTVLGFYSHPTMIGVSLSQFASVAAFYAGEKLTIKRLRMQQYVLRNYIFVEGIAAVLTLILYAPILKTFFGNLGKVSVVNSERMPFVLDLLQLISPGILSVQGAILYGILFVGGLLYLYQKEPRLLMFIMITLILPITLFLSVNPMFVYTRYFIYALPLALLVLGCGIWQITGLLKLQRPTQTLFVLLLLAGLTWLQAPFTKKMITRDRQNYREAIRYVESNIHEPQKTFVFSLGYAGAHFNYYSKNTVFVPATYDEFIDRIKGKTHLWCLITAWLPSLRRPHENVELFSEPPEHVRIYDYVQEHFTLKKEYVAKFPTRVYVLDQ